MKRHSLLQLRWIIACLILIAVLSVGCKRGQAKPAGAGVGMPDPAASYCTKLGYKVEGENCMFPDGTKCNVWAFYRGKCGQKKTYCEQQGYKIENRVEKAGSTTYEYAVCVFDDNSECLEEKYLAGECKPSQCEKWSMAEGGCVTKK